MNCIGLASESMSRSRTKICVVAGASRGSGRGIALALGDTGATVYVTGRTTRGGPPPVDGAPGTIEDTAEQVTARGGVGIPVRVDHTCPADVQSLFERVRREQGRLDVLANAVWGGNERFMEMDWQKPFWEQPIDGWQQMMVAGPFAYLLTASHAAPLFGRGGLIALVTDLIDPKGRNYRGQIYWDLAHECINRLVLGMSLDLKRSHVSVVALNPGFVRTERVLMHVTTEELRTAYRFDLSESPEYIGRAVAALAADRNRMSKSGRLLFVADLAGEYGFTDVDGRLIRRFDPHTTRSTVSKRARSGRATTSSSLRAKTASRRKRKP
jgi:NAD(P)-dependent dehydrogenase (short-subunit alcohol dehydrogenase family)